MNSHILREGMQLLLIVMTTCKVMSRLKGNLEHHRIEIDKVGSGSIGLVSGRNADSGRNGLAVSQVPCWVRRRGSPAW